MFFDEEETLLMRRKLSQKFRNFFKKYLGEKDHEERLWVERNYVRMNCFSLLLIFYEHKIFMLAISFFFD